MSSSPSFTFPSIGLPTPSDTPTPTPASSAQQTPTPSQPPSTTSDPASSTGDPNSSSSSSSEPQSSSSTASSSSSTESSSSSSSSLPTSSSSTFTTSSSSSRQEFSTSLEQSTRSDGGVITVTHTFSFSQEGPTETGNAAAANGNSNPKGFFHNKGAVAGVFTIVGLVVAVIAIALITNAVRRRRAKKFDRDVAEAAAEAAAATHNIGPEFDDDEYGYTNRSVYTDHTHGTYNQTPMKHAESYTMSELPPFDSYGAGAAAGNAGVGAAGLNRSRSTTTPYNAFAGPLGAPPPMPTQPDPYFDPNPPAMPMHGAYPGVYNDPQSSLLDAAGLGAPAGTGVAAAATAVALSHSSTLSRNKSSGTRTLGGMSGSDHQDPYADDPYAVPYSQPSQQYPYPPQPQPQRGYSPPQQVQYSPPPQSQYLPSQQGHSVHSHSPTPQDANRLSVVSGNDPYAGYASASPTQAKFPNPHSPGSPPQDSDSDSDEPTGRSSEHRSERDEYDRDALDSRASLRDEEDYGYGGGRRVLKVANE